MTPYQFRPGPLSAADAAALTNIARMTRANDGLIVRPPLSMVRQAADGQGVLFLSGASDYFFAQLTSGSSPYSWVERVETAAGTWANGPRSGTTNAYQCQPSTGTPSTPATNDIVVMRASSAVGGVYEFVLADKAGGAVTNVLTFNTGTRVLTSTVSGVPATATIPFGASIQDLIGSGGQDFTADPDNTWVTVTGLTITPPAGTYMILSRVCVGVEGSAFFDGVNARLTLAGSEVTGSRALVLGCVPSVFVTNTATIVTFVTCDGTQAIAMQVQKIVLFGTISTAVIQQPVYGETSIEAIRLA